MASDLVADLRAPGARARPPRHEGARTHRHLRPARRSSASRSGRRPADRSSSRRTGSTAWPSTTRPAPGQGAAVAVARLDGTQQLTTYLGPPPRVVRREQPTAVPPDDRPPARRQPLARRPNPRPARRPEAPRPEPDRPRRSAEGARRRPPDRRREAGRPRLPPGRVPLRRHRRPARVHGRRRLLARLRQRRLDGPLRRQLVRRGRHRRVLEGTAACRAASSTGTTTGTS